MGTRKRSRDDGHGRLDEGSYHHTCCSQMRERALPVWIDDDPESELVIYNRIYRCEHGVWDFALNVRSWHGLASAVVDVLRCCAAHRNYHIHVWPWGDPVKQHVHPVHPIDTLEEMQKCHAHACATFGDEVLEVREAWLTGTLWPRVRELRRR